jgi:hypothetical protein
MMNLGEGKYKGKISSSLASKSPEESSPSELATLQYTWLLQLIAQFLIAIYFANK